jgi:predicted NUDIX family phosphoesterase
VNNIDTREEIGYLFYSDLDERLPIAFPYIISIQKNPFLEFGIRSEVEDSKNKVQLIPILVITNKERNRVFTARKNPKQTSKQSPEADKLLIYFGGHIAKDDVVHNNNASNGILSVIKCALHREVKEELGIDFFPTADEINPLCIWTRSNEKSRKHLAVCFVLETDLDTLRTKLDENEFIPTSGKVFELDKMFSNHDKLEEWGQIILKEMFGKQKKGI